MYPDIKIRYIDFFILKKHMQSEILKKNAYGCFKHQNCFVKRTADLL